MKRSAERELRALQKSDVKRVTEQIKNLALDPRPAGCQKLSHQERYRLRQGDYRIVYSIDDGTRTIHIVKIGHRREVYRD